MNTLCINAAPRMPAAQQPLNLGSIDSAQKAVQLPAFDPAVQLTLVAALAAVRQQPDHVSANVQIDSSANGTPLHSGFMVLKEADGKVKASAGGLVANNYFSADYVQPAVGGYDWGGRYGNNVTKLHIEVINQAADVVGSIGAESVKVDLTPMFQPGTQTLTGYVATGSVGGEQYTATTTAQTLDGKPADLKAVLSGQVAGRLVEHGALNNMYRREGKAIDKVYDVAVTEHPGEQKFHEVTLHGSGNNAGVAQDVTVNYALFSK